MINKNDYRPPLKKFLIAFLIAGIPMTFIFGNFNLKAAIDNEIQEFQSNFTTFSSPTLLVDNGSGRFFKDIGIQDIPLIVSKVSTIIFDGFFKEVKKDPKIELFIKFRNLEKIYSDRDLALANGIRTNSSKVPCKISDGMQIYKCKVRLKGDLPEHWFTKKRMSLKIEIVDGYLHGLKEFSIQKPRSRQFPYDQAFHEINASMGRLSQNGQLFMPIFVNGESWGSMNIEPSIDQLFLEAQDIKRTTLVRISNQKKWEYNLKDNGYDDYYISDPRLYFDLIGKKKDTYDLLKNREIYSYLGDALSSGSGEIFDRNQMISNLSLALVWGSLHTLFNSNAYYAWNDYTHKLEPVLTDQEHWRPLSQIMDIEAPHIRLPFEYKLIFQSEPILPLELKMALEKIQDWFIDNNPLDIINNISLSNYPNNREFEFTPLFENLEFLLSNYELVSHVLNASSMFPANDIRAELKNEQLEDFGEFVRLMHFDSGKLNIYNLTGIEVLVHKVEIQDEVILVNKTIPPSNLANLEFLTIMLPKKGRFDGEVIATTSINGFKKIASNDFTFITNNRIDSSSGSEKCLKANDELPCIISKKLIVDKTIVFDKKVRVLAGTEIILNRGSSIIFQDSVEMMGSPTDPILIKSQGMGAVIVKNSKEGISIVENVFVENLGVPEEPLFRYTGAFNGYGGKFILRNFTLSANRAEDQLNIVHADIEVDDLVVTDAISDAFDCDFCDGNIYKMKVNQSNGDGLDVSGSDLFVEELTALNINDKALSVGERSRITVAKLFARGSGTGIAAKDASKAVIENYSGLEILYDDFMTYTKKPFFTGKTQLIIKSFSDKDLVRCTREQGTLLEISGESCLEKDVDVKQLYSTIMKK